MMNRSGVFKSTVTAMILLYIIGVMGCAHQGKGSGVMSSSGKYRDVIIVDLDNDGHLDIVGGSSFPGNVVIFYGDGTGNLSRPKFLSVQGDIHFVTAADFNHDGLKDIAFSVQRGSAGVMVWEAQSNRSWVRGKAPTETNQYEQVLTADINGDGHMDIIAANATSDTTGGVQVWLGDGNGGWPVESGPTVTGRYMGIAVADYNGDKFLDIAGAGWGKFGTLRVWFGDGSGGWSTASIISGGSYYSLSTGDINNDGFQDLIAGTYRSGVRIFYGKGDGGFSEGKGPEREGSFWKAVPVHLDRGKTVDLLAGSIESKGLRRWQQIGLGYWKAINKGFPSHGNYYGISIGDLNEDGYNDICAAGFGEGVKIWLGGKDLISRTTSGPVRSAKDETPKGRADVDENAVFKTIDGVPEYKIGPGDVLEITLWKGVEGLKDTVPVRPDGKLSYGFIQDLSVRGLTASELDTLLTDLLSETIRNPHVDVMVREFRSKFVTFSGAVNIHRTVQSGSGRYALSGKAGILEMLARAGGPARDANLRDVRVHRKNGRTVSLDLYKAIYLGDSSQDMILDDGDLVFIPSISTETNRIYVFGEVKAPGAYTISEGDMRIFDAVARAGGLTDFAKAGSTKIVRGDIANPEIISADLEHLIQDGDWTQNVSLQAGDLVYVPRTVIGDLNLFTKKIMPLLQLIVAPASIVNSYDTAVDVFEGK